MLPLHTLAPQASTAAAGAATLSPHIHAQLVSPSNEPVLVHPVTGRAPPSPADAALLLRSKVAPAPSAPPSHRSPASLENHIPAAGQLALPLLSAVLVMCAIVL